MECVLPIAKSSEGDTRRHVECGSIDTLEWMEERKSKPVNGFSGFSFITVKSEYIIKYLCVQGGGGRGGDVGACGSSHHPGL
jgi:hypothetical protein